ncbi:MAG TPA: hypothetical protein VFJ70_19655 [Burkholderiales bacterium]|nr:hypothetical protein [Burkholderiales bacterium]
MRAVAVTTLAAVLIQGCETPKPASEQIEDKLVALHDAVIMYVPDAGRKQRLHPAIDGFDEESRAFSAVMLAYQESLRALNADPDATREQFAALAARYDAERAAHRGRVTQHHYSVIALTTAEEWHSLARYEAALFELEFPARTSGARAGVVLTGAPLEELHGKARAAVGEPQRQRAIDAALARWREQAARIEQAREQNRKALLALLPKHDVVSAEFERLYAQADAIEQEALEAALDMRFAVREQLSAGRWRELFASPRASSS